MQSEPSLLVLGSTGFLGREVSRQCAAHGVSMVKTARQRADHGLRFDASNSKEWSNVERIAIDANVTAIIDLIAPTVNPTTRGSSMPKSMEKYGDRLVELSSRTKAKIVHAGTDLEPLEDDSYTNFKRQVEESLAVSEVDLSVIKFPRLLGSELPRDFFAMKAVESVVQNYKLELVEPHAQRKFLSVRIAAQVLLANAFWNIDNHRCGLDNFTVTLSNEDFVKLVELCVGTDTCGITSNDHRDFYGKVASRWKSLLMSPTSVADEYNLLEVVSVEDEVYAMIQAAAS